jgi:hypothetical protein
VIRDAYWTQLYKGAQSTSSDLAFCERLANSIWMANEHYNLAFKKKCDKRTIFLSKAPVQNAVVKKVPLNTCSATNINGNRCQNKAVCGKFCKRHEVTEVPDILMEDSDSDISDSESEDPIEPGTDSDEELFEEDSDSDDGIMTDEELLKNRIMQII